MVSVKKRGGKAVKKVKKVAKASKKKTKLSSKAKKPGSKKTVQKKKVTKKKPVSPKSTKAKKPVPKKRVKTKVVQKKKVTKKKPASSKKSAKVKKPAAKRKPVKATKKASKKVSRKTTRKKAASVVSVRPMSDFDRALLVGRPPNVVKLFPNSKALLVSGKFIDRAMLVKGNAVSIATNARNNVIIRGALQAAQRANAALIIEVARSEGGASGYCAINYWNLARQVDAVCNELSITIPVAVHADHYGIKSVSDIAFAKNEIPTLFGAGITSIAIDASHMPDDQCLFANLELALRVPDWAGLETEVGEIKGSEGLSTVDEALFLIMGLNAYGIFPDWIALNNGTVHGIQESGLGIQVELTVAIHDALRSYHVSGAQHGTSGNSTERLREIVNQTHTTKANVATALQMLSWGLEVNDYGNARLDEYGRLVKVPGQGMSERLWSEMMDYAHSKGLKGGSMKKLNLPFENKIMGQHEEIRMRMAKRVEDFVYNLITEVFNAQDTAPMAIEEILKAGTYMPKSKATRLEDPMEWTREMIIEKAASLEQDDSPQGDFDD